MQFAIEQSVICFLGTVIISCMHIFILRVTYIYIQSIFRGTQCQALPFIVKFKIISLLSYQCWTKTYFSNFEIEPSIVFQLTMYVFFVGIHLYLKVSFS